MLVIGGYVICSALLLCVLLFEKYRVDYTIEYAEDILTASALGGLSLNDKEKAIYSVSGEAGFEEAGLRERYETIANLCTTAFENSGIASGEIEITNVTMYSITDERTKYTFTNRGNTLSEAPMNADERTKGGDLVEKTSVYLEVKIPVKLFGNEHTMLKGVYVEIRD